MFKVVNTQKLSDERKKAFNVSHGLEVTIIQLCFEQLTIMLLSCVLFSVSMGFVVSHIDLIFFTLAINLNLPSSSSAFRSARRM